MFNRILAVILATLMGATLFGGCSSASPENSAQQTSLNGTWTGEADGAAFTATVNADRVKLDMKLRDTSGLYWAGSFKSLVNGPATIKSDGDTEILSKSMFGSLDKTKSFTYEDDAIKFSFGIAGTTRDVTLTKVDS
jgi:hypothetical protein